MHDIYVVWSPRWYWLYVLTNLSIFYQFYLHNWPFAKTDSVFISMRIKYDCYISDSFYASAEIVIFKWNLVVSVLGMLQKK